VRRFSLIILVLAGFLAGVVRADTFKLEDGQTVSGDIVSCNESGLIVRLPDGKYSDRISWTKFSQADLKRLAQNPKVAPLVEPFLEVPLDQKPKPRPPVVKTPDRLAHPEVNSVFGALFASNVGIVLFLILYGANIYAAYEVAIFRAQPRALVCGLAAIPLLGLLVPVVFLAMPTRREPAPVEEMPPETPAAAAGFAAPESPAPEAAAAAAAEAAPGGLRLSQAQGDRSTGTLPTTQVFQRGAYTFNRRFFETKFPAFFGVIRRDADKDMVLVVKSARGQYSAQRISRIAANDVHFQIQKGSASEEVMIPFGEIQEIQLKHKDA
jgi:hypothetical protein